MASVIGEKFSPELIGFVLDQETLGVLETLNAVAQSTSLVRVEGDLYKFDHAKIQKILYEEIPSPLKKGYHARVAQRLENKGKIRKELPLSDLAYHYAQAGNKEKAVEYTLEAGEDALARFGNVEAIKHFSYVLQTIGEDARQAEKRTRALQGLGEAFFANSMFKEAMKAFERIYNTETGIARLRAFRWAMDSAFFHGDTLHLSELVKVAEECAIVDRIECARVRMNRGRYFLLVGNAKAGLEDFEEALHVDEEEYSLSDTARTLVGLGPAYAANLKLESALVAELRAIALYEELRDLRGQMDACNRAAQNCFFGLKSETVNMFLKAIRIGEKIGDYNRVAEASAFLSQYYEISDDLNEALSQSLRALEYCQKTDSVWIIGVTYANLVRQYSKLGDLARAQEYFEKLGKLHKNGSLGQFGLTGQRRIVQDILSRAVIFAAQYQWKESKRCFNEIFEVYNIPPNLIGRARGRTEPLVRRNYIWALERQGLIEEANTLRDEGLRIQAEALKMFEQLNLEAHLMSPAKVGVGQTFEARLDIVNASKGRGLLLRVENLPITKFRVTTENQEWIVRGDSADLQEKPLTPFGLVTLKFNLQALTPCVVSVDLQVVYVDEFGETHARQANPVNVTVNPTIYGRIGEENVSVPILPGRLTTGFTDLDTLLYGGIPQGYAIVLLASPSDERKQLIKRFAEAGAKTGQPTFYLTSDIGDAATLMEHWKSSLYVFICTPRVDALAMDNANLFRLKGVENLTEIDIALVKAFRSVNASYVGAKRACIEITSDVLLQHKAIITRKWLSGLLADLKAKGFTTLAVIDPQMHPQEDVQAILGLFEGELRVTERESTKGPEKVLRVTKLYNQKYFNQEITLNRNKLVDGELS
jgi:tetratricopeptide (TPR) repeat protein/KaiC/GvpD/RAD55 family RecA-like ATPase